jgi:hypothetical protein
VLAGAQVLVFEALPQLARRGRGVGPQALAEQLVEALGVGVRQWGVGLQAGPQRIARRRGVAVELVPE